MPPVIQQSLVLKNGYYVLFTVYNYQWLCHEKPLPACRVYLSLWIFRNH